MLYGYRLGFRLFSAPSVSLSLRLGQLRSFTMGAIGAQTVNTTQRLQSLRELMKQTKHNVHALVVPSEDQRTL
jgi:hypothetical protein